MPRSSSASAIKHLGQQATAAKERAAMYKAVERAATAEASAADARVKGMTPLPRLPHDKDTLGKVKSMRTRYASIAKSARAIASTCKSKQHALEKTVEAAVRRARKIRDDDMRADAKKKQAQGSTGKPKASKPKNK